MIVAAFDVDNTLTTRDTVVPFLRSFGGRGRSAATLMRRAHHVANGAARRDRDRLRAIATAAVFAGRPWDEVDAAAERHAGRIIAGWLRPDTCARLAWHRDQGHAVLLVSAGYEAYLRRVGLHLGADDVLATRLAVDGGRCTGALDGANCRGAEKVARIAGWLEQRELTRADVTLWAYGDSIGDRELLAAADHPVRVAGRIGSVAATPATS